MGYRATLLLPMLGVVVTALVAGALARRLGDPDGALAFWVVGAASPLLLYGLDLWEHSLGVAACTGAVLLLVDAVGARGRWWHPLVAGLLLGGAATLRTEALVYAAVAVGVAVLVTLKRGHLARALGVGSLAVVGFAPPWLANRWLEDAVGALSRGQRASGAASAAGSRLGERVEQALVTTFGMKGGSAGSVAIGLAVVALVLVAVRAEQRGDRRLATITLALAALPYLLAAVSGLSFVPGSLAAFPLAVLALVRRPTGAAAMVVLIALGALPLIWGLSYVAGAAPQWGGRYTLTSTVLLGVVATVDLLRRHPVVARGLLAITVGVSALSVLWLGVRSRSVDDLFADLRAVDAEVLIARDGFLLREGGASLVDRRWLSVADEDAFTTATRIAERSGARRVAVVERDAAVPPTGVIPGDWREVGRTTSNLTGSGIGIVVYELPG